MFWFFNELRYVFWIIKSFLFLCWKVYVCLFLLCFDKVGRFSFDIIEAIDEWIIIHKSCEEEKSRLPTYLYKEKIEVLGKRFFQGLELELNWSFVRHITREVKRLFSRLCASIFKINGEKRILTITFLKLLFFYFYFYFIFSKF